MTTEAGIAQFLETLDFAGLLSERKGAPKLGLVSDRKKLARLWLSMTADVTDEDLQCAIASYLRDPKVCQWYPQPGTLLAHLPGRRDAQIDNADELWGVVLSAVRHAGSYWKPEWKGPDAEAIQAGVDALGGWQHLCQNLKVDDVANRAAFRSVVRSVKQRAALQLEEGPARALIGDMAGNLRMFPKTTSPPPDSFVGGYDHAPDGVDLQDSEEP